jgi:hypothetical protein
MQIIMPPTRMHPGRWPKGHYGKQVFEEPGKLVLVFDNR